MGSGIRLGATAALLAVPCTAHATAGFSCDAHDAAVTFSIVGAFGRSIGSGIANFSGRAEIKSPGTRDKTRKLRFEVKHLSENWFENRDLKLAVHWLDDGPNPSAEVVLLVETRRAGDEDAPYRGRYRLLIFLPDGNGKPREISGRVTCTAE